ncbi:MAG: hypothetical protein H6573_26830 [Lewinellaceae bacterium]|nr:hypothetical protein [Lewinellaceae bacterium]
MKNLNTHPLTQPFWHQKNNVSNDSEHTDTYEWDYLLEIRADTTFDLTVIKFHVYTSMKWSENSYSGNWAIMELQDDLLRLNLHFLTEKGLPVNFIFQYDGNYVQLKAATKMDQEYLSKLLDAENCFPRNTAEPNKMTISTKIICFAIGILLFALGFWYRVFGLM